MSALRLALAAIVLALLFDVAWASQPPAVSSLGLVGNPFEHPVAMRGPCVVEEGR